MRLLNFLSGIAPVLICLAAPNEGGGSAAPSGDRPSASSPEPAGNTLEEKFASAKIIISDFFKQVGGAMKERDDEQSAHAATKGLLKTEQDAHTETKGQLKKEQDATAGANLRADKAEAHLKLLESFAKHHNLDLAGLEQFQAAKIIPEVQGDKDSGKAIYDEWQRIKASGDGKKATAYSRKHKAALAEYAESTR